MSLPSRPKVSVAVLTYNQAPYIRQTLDSILMQESSFDVQVLVHDDASTDGTRQVLESYAAAHPGRVELLLQDQNQFSQGGPILSLIWPRLRGDYIAILEGDDYWTDPRKLASQAAFLDAHDDCALCQTRTMYLDDATAAAVSTFPPPHRSSPRHSLADLASGNFVQTCAVMIRRAALPKVSDGIDSLPFGDYALFALAARAGWIGLIDEEMAVYRIHDSNFWANRPRADRVEKTELVRAYIAHHLPAEARQPWIRPLTPSFVEIQRRRISRRLRTLIGR